MRTPAGQHCRHYYEDFNRGRAQQECRLILANRNSLPWTPDLCARCKVPGILLANPSPQLRLRLALRKRLGLWRVLRLEASCLVHDIPVSDPAAGCPECARQAP